MRESRYPFGARLTQPNLLTHHIRPRSALRGMRRPHQPSVLTLSVAPGTASCDCQCMCTWHKITELKRAQHLRLLEHACRLEKISHEHPAACLRHGGLLASLTYLDFFQTGVQRVAVATAANMCRSITSENTAAVADAIPILTSLLQYQV